MYTDPHTHLQLTRTATDQAVRRSQHLHDLPPATTRRPRFFGRLGLVRPRLGTIRTAGRVRVAVTAAPRRPGAEAL